MSGTLEMDTEYDEDYGELDGEAAEFDYGEARPAGRTPFRPVPMPPRGSAYKPRTSPAASQAPVTQAQLQAALGRVSQQIGINSKAIKTLDGRVRGLHAEQGRLAAVLRKESAERKKEVEAVRRDLNSTREMIALISLLFPAGSSGTAASIAPLIFLLPPDFLNGVAGGGSSSSSSSSNGSQSMFGGNGMVALVAVAAASGLFK